MNIKYDINFWLFFGLHGAAARHVDEQWRALLSSTYLWVNNSNMICNVWVLWWAAHGNTPSRRPHIIEASYSMKIQQANRAECEVSRRQRCDCMICNLCFPSAKNVGRIVVPVRRVTVRLVIEDILADDKFTYNLKRFFWMEYGARQRVLV